MEHKQFCLALLFSGVYHEVDLQGEPGAVVVVGTTKNCGVRLSKDLFFSDFELHLNCGDGGDWTIQSGAETYLSKDGGLKLRSLQMEHGSRFTVCYQNSGAKLCSCEFFRNYDGENRNFELCVDLHSITMLEIGGRPGCHIHIQDAAIGDDSVQLIRRGDIWELSCSNVAAGVSVNGRRCTEDQQLEDLEFFAISGRSFFLSGEHLYFCKSPNIHMNGITAREMRDSSSGMTYPRLNRSTRVYYKTPEKHIRVQDPPKKEREPEQNILVTLLPMLAMLGVTVLLRGVLGSGGSFVIFSVCSMGIGIATSIYNYFHQKKTYEQKEAARQDSYAAYLRQKQDDINIIRRQEQEFRERNTPSIEVAMESVRNFDGRLYERQSSNPDFLSVRLGSGSYDSCCSVDYTEHEFRNTDDPLAEQPEELARQNKQLTNAPVLLPLRGVNMVDIVGPAFQTCEMVRLMTMDLAIHHSFQDLQLAYLLPSEETERWNWLRWLRHVRGTDGSRRNLAYHIGNYKNLLDFIYKELSERESRVRNEKTQSFLPNYVIFILEPYDILSHPISRFFQGTYLGCTFVFCGDTEELLPPCSRMVRLRENYGEILDSEDGCNVQTFVPSRLSESMAKAAAEKLACVSLDEVSLDSQLTRSVNLFHLLGIFSVEDVDLRSRWENSEVYRSMAAPLGVDAKGRAVCLDLHEKAHGPHGLVAGTTGSGKSELLQTFILSMALLFHPHEVGFVIIDFKGGGMVNQFHNLPHLIGSITDIDGREIERNLKSIRAELNRRKELFAIAGVNHIDAYIKAYKSGAVETPLPHLILIVDEFAELKAEQPEFMKELTSAARVGRSLGVHLILATQKPAGVVDAQIWSNSRFRLCLKVATAEDSKEMIKTPLAVEIQEPGRAYLQVGNNEIFELFQSAYSGADCDSEIAMAARNYHIDRVHLDGSRECIFLHKAEREQEKRPNQLQALVDYVGRYCAANGIERLPGICLPPLPSVLTCPELERKQDSVQIQALLGVYDAPERQSQNPYYISLSTSNVLVVGSSLSGKTSVLQQIIRSLSQSYSPSEVSIYIIDFASKALGIFDKLNHVGGCVFNDQEDRVRTLIRMLCTEVHSRKERFSSIGITSFAGYKETEQDDLPQIVVMMDNFVAFRELYPGYDEELLFLLREGVSVGLSFVVTALQSTGIGFRYLGNFGSSVVLHCNDSGEYASILDHCRVEPKNVAGRALVSQDKSIYEMQTYLAFEGEQEIERVRSIRQYIAWIAEKDGDLRARRIPEVPAELNVSWLERNDPDYAAQSAYGVTLGMSYDPVDFVRLDVAATPMIALCGGTPEAQVNFAGVLLDSLQKRVFTSPAVCYILDAYDRQLGPRQKYGIVQQYTTDLNEGEILLEQIVDLVQERQDWLKDNEVELLQNAPLVLLVVRNPEFYNDNRVDELFKNLYRQASGLKVCFLFAAIPNATVSYSAGSILKSIKENRQFFFLESLENVHLVELTPAVLRANRTVLQAGDCYHISGSEVLRLKVANA